MKKIASVLITVILAFSVALNAFAADDSMMSEKAKQYKAIKYFESTYPGAQAIVDENGVLQVYIPEQQSKNTLQITATSIYAPNGGSYRSFTPPIGSDPYGDFPYSMIYLPGDQTAALLAARNIPGLFPDVITWSATGISFACSMVYAKYGVLLNPSGIVLLVGIYTANLMNWINTTSLSYAALSTGKVCITRSTTMGIPTNIYISWSGSYVTDAPYSDWGPSFYASVYDIAGII